MTDGLDFDEGMLADLARLYATDSMTRRRAFVRDRLDLQAGDSVLSVGTGPGFEVEGLAAAVGPGGRVLGVDASPAMLAAARERCAGDPQASFEEGAATALPVEDGAFDRAAAVQVYEYVEDVDAALAELHRALAPGGRAVVFDSDWDSLAFGVEDGARGERVLSAYDAHCPHPRVARWLRPALSRAGFEVVEVAPFTHVETAPGGVGSELARLVGDFVAARAGDVEAAEVDAWLADLDARAEAGEFFFSFSQYAFVAEA